MCSHPSESNAKTSVIMLPATPRTVRYHGKMLQIMGYHDARDGIPPLADLKVTTDEVLAHLNTIQQGSVVFRVADGSYAVNFNPRGEEIINLTVKTVQGKGIVVETPMAREFKLFSTDGRQLIGLQPIPVVKAFTSDLEDFNPGATHAIIRDAWRWPDDTNTLDFDHESIEFRAMLQLKFVSKGLGFQNKCMTYTCCTVAELAVFLDTFLGTYIWDSICEGAAV